MKSAMTASERWVAKRLKKTSERDEVAAMRREIEVVDELVRALEERRAELGISKIELARRINGDRGSLQRLLKEGGNPTLQTYLSIAQALGCTVNLVKEQTVAPARVKTLRAPKRARATSKGTAPKPKRTAHAHA
jgi:DNA-binding phage protein